MLAGGLACGASAQVLEVGAAVAGAAVAGSGAGAPAAGPLEVASGFSVALRQVRVGSTTVGVAVTYSSGARVLGSMQRQASTGTGAAQLDLTLAAIETFGPLGNVIFELAGSVRTDALAHAALTVRGTIGPVAARVSLTAFSADAVVFSPAALAGDDRPILGRGGLGAALGVTARFGRNVILDVEPDLYLTGAGSATRLEARLRRLRTFGDNELRAYLTGAWAANGWTLSAHGAPAPASAERWHAAIGAGVLLPRGRAPDIELALLLGTNGVAVRPGVRVSAAEALPGGVRLALDGSLEPYRVDVHPLRVAATLELPVAAHATLGFTAVTAALDATRPTVVALQSTFRIPVDLR